ncbi:hypothetical protein M2137_002144 [Parabacteroides sp. PFB2-10]|nr:hypothetical protein [Parabacteroides sp. PFB2-10]
MRLNNILLIASFLFATVACSMEDDVLNEITKANPTTDADATELYVSFDLNGTGLGTKAGTSTNGTTTPSNMIETASVIVFKGDNVYSAKDGVSFVKDENGIDTNVLNMQVLLKTGTTYDVYVIGDSKESFAGLTTRSAVEAAYLGKDDANKTDLNKLVKFGKTDKFMIPKEEGYPTIEDARKPANIKALPVHLQQLTAKVELKEVNVSSTFANNTLPTDVTLKSVRLLNQNTMRQLKDGQVANPVYANVAWNMSNGFKLYDVEDGKVTEGLPATLASFVTYPNSGVVVDGKLANLTALELTFEVGSNTEKRTYVINRETAAGDFTNNTGHPYIQAGYIYQLTANVKVTGDNIECTVKCYTLDWLYNEFEVEVEEVTSEALE